MLPGPILRREMRAATSGRGRFVTRMVLATLIGVVATAPTISDRAGAYKPESLRNFALFLFAATIGIEIVVLGLLAAASAGSSIAEEREKDTLPLLLLTRLTRLELAMTKLLGRLLPTLLLAVTGLPFLLVSGWFTDLPVWLVSASLGLLASTLAVATAFGILASAQRERSRTARTEGVVWTMAWLFLLPLLSRLPAASGSLLGDLMVEVRRLCALLAPSSPFSLVTDSAWFSSGPGIAASLAWRLGLMAAMQGGLLVLVLTGVVACLRLREPRAKGWDAFGGYRPPMDDDPIYWREYLLPARGARRLLIWTLVLQLMNMLRVLFILALQTVAVMMFLGFILGLGYYTAWFGWRAFQEAWRGRVFPSGPYEARDQLNWFIRFVTFTLGLSPAAAMAAAMASKIVIERDKKTWDSLLTTPLSGTEIVASKMRGIERGLLQAARWLIPLWVLEIACDALHPLGAVAAGLGCAAVARLGVALGARAALRPGTTSLAANNAAAYWMFGLWGVGALTIIAPLSSSHQLQFLHSQSPRLFWLAVVVIAGVDIGMAAVGRKLTQTNFDRFDEWVDRPHRNKDAPAPLATPDASPLRLDPEAIA